MCPVTKKIDIIRGPLGGYEDQEEVQIKPWYDTVVTRRISPAYYGGSQEPEETKYEDATIMGLDQGRTGMGYMLRIPQDEDPEVGGYWDCDGDRSMERIMMMSGKAIIAKNGVLIITGLVQPDEEKPFFQVEEWYQSIRVSDETG